MKKHGRKPVKGGLGRSIVKAGRNRTYEPISDQHSQGIEEKAVTGKLRSVTDADAMAEFLADAELAERDFFAEKQHVVILEKHSFVNTLAEDAKHREKLERELGNRLTIPRRPKWESSMTKKELDSLERKTFLEWRRSLADLEEKEGVLLTPFEKNLEVWRQLWRVVERSDVVVQIVDARDPLLFRSIDLENYVKQVNPRKINILLINKADLLTASQRRQWAKFFIKSNIQYRFWSALNESNDAKENVTEQKTLRIEELDSEIHVYDRDELIEEFLKMRLQPNDDDTTENQAESYLRDDEGDDEDDEADQRSQFSTAMEYDNTKRLVVGMIGYPNVGKSSTINALCQAKKVAVSSTPGKTKHFQTLLLGEELCLCDCPGLVFPSFVSTKAEMIVNGLLPIDQMRDHIGPVTLICNRIKRRTIENAYGIILPKPADYEPQDRPPTAAEFLQTYAHSRGFTTAASGLPDEMRAARLVLKDYVNGIRLLHCHPPPGGWEEDTEDASTSAHTEEQMTEVDGEKAQSSVSSEKKNRRKNKNKKKSEPYKEDDLDFRKQEQVVAHTKGKLWGQTSFTRPNIPGVPLGKAARPQRTPGKATNASSTTNHDSK